MAKDMADTVEEMLRGRAAPRTSRSTASRCPRAGRSTRSAPRAWATIRRTSVTDRFCRLHDVNNVYIADAAPFVSGGTQNTTWSILAMCWRTMDYLKERLRAGDV